MKLQERKVRERHNAPGEVKERETEGRTPFTQGTG